jgi:aryl-alcohol dehydrogenase-like predicted oxidoreductase
MSDFYGHSDRMASLATISAALEAGITLFDTGDFHGMGHNEMLLAEALRGKRIGITAYGVLGRGLLTGSKGNGQGDWRARVMPLPRREPSAPSAQYDPLQMHWPRLQEAKVSPGLRRRSRGSRAGQDIIPLVGARTVERLLEAMKAPLELLAEVLGMIENAVPKGAVRGGSHMSASD